MQRIGSDLVSPIAARILGLVMLAGGVIAGWAFAPSVFGPPSPSRAGPLLFYPLSAFMGLVIMVAVVQGARMLLAPAGSTQALPVPVLLLGVILLLLGAAVQIILWFTVRHLSNPVMGLALGVGGAIGAGQLIRERLTRTRAGDGA